jgi:hypothetical protein
MNPNNSWIASQRKSGPGDVLAYWIDTCFVDVPNAPVMNDVLEKLAAGGADIPPEFAEFAAIVEHEQVHWIQAHALGYGRFQSRIHHALSEIAESFFGMFTPSEVNILMTRRALLKPVLMLNERYFPVRQSQYGPIGVAIQQHWWNLRLLKFELDAPATELKRLRSMRLRYGLAVLYTKVHRDVSKVALMEPSAVRDNALYFAPEEDYAHAMERCQFPWLSAKSICECAAVLNQLFSYAYMGVQARARCRCR